LNNKRKDITNGGKRIREENLTPDLSKTVV